MIIKSIKREGEFYLSKKSLCDFLEKELANHKEIGASRDIIFYIQDLINRLAEGEYTPTKSNFEKILEKFFGSKGGE